MSALSSLRRSVGGNCISRTDGPETPSSNGGRGGAAPGSAPDVPPPRCRHRHRRRRRRLGPQVAAPPEASDPSAFAGRGTRVLDGDTFWLDSQPVSIRVFGLDAPERGQPAGSASTAALPQMISGEQLTCRQRDFDRYGQIVGQCFTSKVRDVAAVMIAGGTATECCRYSGGEYGTC